VPTETVYGLAGNAFDPRACAKIFRVKGRPADDPLIVHVHALAQLEEICELNAATLQLAKRFWPGPLTIVLPKKTSIPRIVTAGRDSVAVRIPSHPVFRRLLRATGLPLAAPSANPFGYISPTTAVHVHESLGQKIPHILDGGAARVGLESTIVDLRNPNQPMILRPGFISAAEIERVLQQRVIVPRKQKPRLTLRARAHFVKGRVAPGLFARHYSPRTPVRLHSTLTLPKRLHPEEAYLLLSQPAQAVPPNVFWLDPAGDLRGAARRLFATLRQLDAMKFAMIHVELAPGAGLAEAINDRLRRAAAR
jgi:L-threonylcarbamoyladenylate synthase